LPRNLPQPKRKIFNLALFSKECYDFHHPNRAKRGIFFLRKRTLRLQNFYINTKSKTNPDFYQGLGAAFLKEPTKRKVLI